MRASSPARTRRHGGRARILPPLSAIARFALLVFLPSALLAPVVLVAASGPASAVPPTMSVSLSGPGEIIAGDDATYSFSATNTGATDGFNLGFILDVPEGIEFVSSSLGDPVVYDALNPPPTPLPAGIVRWVWEDVSDLPASGTYGGTVTVHPTQPVPPDASGTVETSDVDVFPVGSTYTLDGYAALSGDPTYLPVFNGSTGVGGPVAESETTEEGPSTPSTDVIALNITKSEPSTESELPRGVHDQTTVYDIQIRNTTEGPTHNTILVDYIPAGLEFLGCGGVDNSTVDREPGDPTINEYLNSPDLTGTPVIAVNCPTPISVETVVADAAAASTYGVTAGEVYTVVTWDLGTLAAGETRTVRYAAAIPLYENTIAWDGLGGEPAPASLGQTANLDNNNGPSTRHGDPATHVDGDTWTNVANVWGDYFGIVRTGADRATTDRDNETVYAMDLHIHKDVTGGSTTFEVNTTTEFTLTLTQSEYMNSEDIVVTDTIPNGLCPLLPAGTPLTEHDGVVVTPECLVPTAVTGADVVSVDAYGDGTFVVVLRPTSAAYPDPDDFILGENEDHLIVFDVLNRDEYELAPSVFGPTTSGDGFGNQVEFDATSFAVPDLMAWFPDDWFVWDDSGASLGSDYTTIDKLVMPRDEVEVGLGPGVNPCTLGTYVEGPEVGFRMGDTVCFQLTVDFPTSIDVRNPVVTDFLPRGLQYEGHEISPASTVPLGEIVTDDSAAVSDGRLQWLLGHPNPGDPLPDLYVTRGQVLIIDLWATVVAPSSGPILDKPENLMKYRQQNVEGVLYFLRDEAEMEIDPELELIKGVLEVEDNASAVSSTRPALSEDDPDGTVFASNRDGIQVREGEIVTYRVDLRTMPYPAEDVVVWDVLAPGITAADVSNISDSGVAYDPGDPGYPAGIVPAMNSRSVIIWTGVDVTFFPAFGESRHTLEYDVTMPLGTSVSTTYDNDASIIQYAAAINTSVDLDAQPYYPSDSYDESLSGSWNTPGTYTRDDSSVYIALATIDKTVDSPLDANNTATQAVKGEIIEFIYTVTVPAHTSVQNGEITDALETPANWTVHPDDVYVEYPGGATAPGDLSFTIGADTFTVDTSDGTVTFPALYINDTDTDHDFTVHLFVHINSGSGWGHSTTNLRDNTATFSSDTQPDIEAGSGVYAIAPRPLIRKLADDDTVTAGQTVTYELRIRNNGTDNRPTLYDTLVEDCVPPELTGVAIVGGFPTQGAVTSISLVEPGCSGTYIEWDVGALLSGSGNQAFLEYTATVSPASAGLAVYTNPATIGGYSLDDLAADRAYYETSTTESITVLGAPLTKDVDAPTGTIGEERDYTITVTLPADVNFYDAAIIDDVPAGLDVYGVNLACTYGAGGSCLGDLPGGGAVIPASGTDIGWWLGDILSNADTRTITLTYTSTVLNVIGNVAGTSLVDTADLRWSTTDLIAGPPADASYTPDVGSLPDDATVVVVEPDVVVDKLVNGVDSEGVAPGETFTYTVTVTNEGTSTAYAVTVEDTIPTGVVVDEPSISDGGVLSGEDPITGGGTISWSLASLAVGAGNASTFTYDAELAPSSTLDGSSLVNSAEVTGFQSHPTGTPGFVDGELRAYTGPTDDATVTPDFPDPDVVKTPAAGPAYIGQSHSFTIVVTNNGTSVARDVTVVDTLPADWVYDAGSTTVDGAPAGDPAIAGQDLTWSVLPDLDPTESATIVYTAHPDAGATWDATNTGSAFPHTNDVDVTVTDDSGATENGAGPYEDSTNASVTIDRADVAIDKAHVGSPTAGAAFSWTVTVTNNGPDTSVGPVVVVDTLPPDATYTGFTGVGWSDDTSVPGQVTFTHAGPLASGGALPIITVDVNLPDDLAAGTTFDNSVTVTAETLDLETPNNTDDDPASTVVVADVGIDKSSVGGPFTAGNPISWDVVVTNNGPSIAPGLFTVTDTLPATVDWGSVAWSGTGWACSPVTPGGVLTCSWAGAALGVGASLPTLSVDATILPGVTGTVDNDVSVSHPTPDPNPANDTDSTSDPVGTSADLWLVKTTASLDIPANGTGRFRFEIQNDGPSDALDVAVDDTLPGGLTYLGNITANPGDTWSCVPSGPSTVDCTLDSNGGTLPVGASTWFEFDVDADATVTGTVLNTATVTSTTPDPNPPNNTDDSRTAPTLVVNKGVAPTSVERGSAITYTLNVESTSYGSTDDVTLTDPIPANLRIDSITIDPSADPTVPDWLTCDHTGADVDGYGGLLTCVLGGALERGRTTPDVTLVATVHPDTIPGDITNTATVAWTDPFNLGAGVFTAVSSVPLDVTLTAEELAASGVVGLSYKFALILVLVALGIALVRFSRRYREQ